MNQEREVRFRGRPYPVLDTMRIAGKTYSIVERLGHSGRKRYCAFHRNALWAIHVVPHSRRTMQHLRILESVSESNHIVPTIVETQRVQEEVRIVAKWIAGPDLAAYLQAAGVGKHRGLSGYMAFSLFRRFVHGLCHFHDRKHFVHGDLKPDNLIVATDAKQLVMVDFGSAWCEPNARRRLAGDGRTTGYAAPELAKEGAFVDARSDQFSITTVFYEMLTGELPYDNLGGKAGWPEYRSDFESKLVPASRIRRSAEGFPARIWTRIDNVIQRGLQLDPSDRYPSSKPWRDDLDAIQSELSRSTQLSPVSQFAANVIDRLVRRFQQLG